MKTLLLLISIFAIIAGEVDGINIDALPTDVKAELQRAVDSATRARAVYLQAIQQANERANLQLERLIATYTRRGNLDVALSIRNAQEKINNGWVKTQVEKNTDLVGNEILDDTRYLQLFIGRWNTGNTIVTILPNGTTESTSSNTGRWVQNKNRFTITWNEGGIIHNIEFNSAGDLIITNHNGNLNNWTKIR